MPSYVAVPRPTSSRMTSRSSVAEWRMLESSCISTIKVERPLGEFVQRADAGVDTVDEADAGRPRRDETPHLREGVMSAAWRMYVDFPDMLGPVTIRNWRSSSRRRSFGTNSVVCSTTGWRPPWTSSSRPSEVGPRPVVADRVGRQARQRVEFGQRPADILEQFGAGGHPFPKLLERYRTPCRGGVPPGAAPRVRAPGAPGWCSVRSSSTS